MKKIYLLLLIGVFCVPSLLSQEKTGTIEVTVTGLRNAKGVVVLALFNREDGFPMDEKKIFKSGTAEIVNGKAVFIINDLPYGPYAVSVFHDENNNKKMDTGFFGIPIEGLGASNDAKGSFGPPSYKDAKVELSGPELKFRITIVYI